MNSDDSSAADKISLMLSESAKESGIYEIYIDGNRTLTAIIKVPGIDSFSRRVTIDTKKFPPMVRALMKDVKSMLKAKGVRDPIINEIDFQIGNTLNQEENYKLFKDLEQKDSGIKSENDEYKSWYIGKINEIKKQHIESQFSFSDWQSSVAKKYDNLRSVIDKNFPEAWPLLQFCLAVKSILNIDGCTLPFMGVLLAIPSSMKTLVIQLFRKYPQSLYTDNFTPASFVSHNASLNEEQLRKVDLLPKLSNKLFLTPELAPIFTANEDELRKSLGIITRLLDGHGLETDSGAQGHRRYGKTFFVWIGAAVEIPFRIWQLLGTLGHKIYFYRPVLPQKTIQQLEEIAKENDFQNKFLETEQALLDYLIEFDAAPSSNNSKIDENGIVKVKWNQNESDEQGQAITCIAQIANLQKRLRGTVYVSQSKTRTNRYNARNSSMTSNDNDRESDKDDQKTHESSFITAAEQDYDTDYPIVEDPSRAVVMLRNLAIASAISQGRDQINLEDISLIMNVVLSTTTKARSELIRLLLKKGGEVTTSTVVYENKISSPFAKKTMRELAAVGIGNISAVATYSNSEHKITLTDEYRWFVNQGFQKLLDRDKESKSDSTKSGLSDNDSSNAATKARSENHENSSDESENSIRNNCDSPQSYAETKSTLDTHTQNSDTSDTSKNKLPDSTDTHSLDNNSDQLQMSETEGDGQSKADSSGDTELEGKNNVPLWGSQSFRRVTVTRSQEHDQKSDDQEAFDYVVEQIIEEIRKANGSEVAFSFAVQSVCLHNEKVKTYLGDKLTSRENRKVRNLSVAVQRHPNIDPVKYKPQLVLRWKSSEQDNK